MLINSLKSRRDDEEGFTLIELMVVVLIIAILIAIASPTFLGARERAQNRAAQSNLRNALTAEKTFFTDDETSAFEANINDLAAAGITGGCTATRFCGKATITREQMTAFLHRASARTSPACCGKRQHARIHFFPEDSYQCPISPPLFAICLQLFQAACSFRATRDTTRRARFTMG